MSKFSNKAQDELDEILSQVRDCRICADRFAKTATKHNPRPVLWMRDTARLLIAGQAPGARVHQSGQPFTDPSGDRLRDWLGLDAERFYDRDKVAIVPMAFCFPGYNAKGADLPPPSVCARTWRKEIISALPKVRFTILVGGYAQKWHLGTAAPVSEAVADWRRYVDQGLMPLPHPSWRNTGWLKRNPWFESDVLPVLRAKVKEVLDDTDDTGHAA